MQATFGDGCLGHRPVRTVCFKAEGQCRLEGKQKSQFTRALQALKTFWDVWMLAAVHLRQGASGKSLSLSLWSLQLEHLMGNEVAYDLRVRNIWPPLAPCLFAKSFEILKYIFCEVMMWMRKFQHVMVPSCVAEIITPSQHCPHRAHLPLALYIMPGNEKMRTCCEHPSTVLRV